MSGHHSLKMREREKSASISSSGIGLSMAGRSTFRRLLEKYRPKSKNERAYERRTRSALKRLARRALRTARR